VLLLAVLAALTVAALPVGATVEETDGGIFYTVHDGAVTVEGFNAAGTVMRVPAEIEGLPVRYVAERACYGNDVITEVILPDSLISIGELAFSECKSLKKVTVEGCETIGYAAFRNSKKLRSVSLPDNLVTMEDEAFYGCARLGKTVIPSSVTKIGVDAFSGCEQLYLDVSDNGYAATYAEANRLPTSFTETFTFTVLMAAVAVLVLGGGLWVILRILRKKKKQA
jgi:hypothetical protein